MAKTAPVNLKAQKSTTSDSRSLRTFRRDKRAHISAGIIILCVVVPVLGPPI
ncbi:hypothetical protein KSZ_78280 [Dictyobacter formicarum]|uniref:ABC transporter permease n=1 Tax=Dictyobacter formicarum TaxID=2778368 RepID=A0ABQ3VU68_9CHLR|nr:hypothetical protein KSZ_78280 [Dictyobacter formicarum]